MEGRLWLQLHEKGGKELEIPCHHNLETYLSAYVAEAGITTPICNHSFRATGITAYLEIPEARVEVALHLAGHAKTETTKLHDQREERVSLDEIERIGI